MSDFCCSAPIDGGVGGYFLINMNTSINAIADAKNYPAYKKNISFFDYCNDDF